MQRIIEIENGVTRMPEWRLAKPVNFTLDEGEHIAIVGGNASGKTMLVDIITGRHPLLMNEPKYDFRPSTHEQASENIKYIAFRDSYGDNDGQYYLQLRWNQQEIDKETPVVNDLLEKVLSDKMKEAIVNMPYRNNEYSSGEVIKMEKVCIRYGERVILDTLDWTVRNGERW